MSGLIIPLVGMCLQALLLIRGARSRLISKYPFFYVFVAGMLFVTGTLTYVYARLPGLYRACYWSGEFLTLVLAYGVILEIFRHVLSPYPGPSRLARIGGIAAFTAILCSSGVYPLMARYGSVSGRVQDLERDLRFVEAIFLVSVLALISYYGIPIGRNMKGMIAGYGLSVGASLMDLAAYSHASYEFRGTLVVALQLGYAIPFSIWAVTLWSYSPNPCAASEARLEQDYEQLVGRTRATLSALRAHLAKAVGA
jgi:hypothetical protein